MSIGGSSNLGTLLIRRLDTALSVQASQTSQIVNAARADAIAQLADAARINPVHNEGGRPLPETIDKAQSQVERQARQPVESGRLQNTPPGLRLPQPSVNTGTTPSAPTTLGHAAKTILALLSLFPESAPPVRGRAPLILPNTATPATAGQPGAGAASAPATPPGGTAPAPGTGATAAAAASAPPAPEAQPALIARALSQAMGQSGVFYESHLRDLAFGSRTTAQLQQEPQARAGATPAPAPQAGAAAQENTATAARAGGPTPESTASEGRSTTSTASAPPSSASSSTLAGLHPETQLVVRQQLEVLATQMFGWRGEAWPEAKMEWEVGRRNEEGQPDEAGTHWATTLRLTLPSLGEVEARLSLHDRQVVMRLVAPQSAATLMQHDQALRAGFHDAGLTLSQLSILQEDQE